MTATTIPMVRVVYRTCLAAVVLFLIAGSVNSQSVAGRWVWKEVARKDKPQTQFTLVIHREGNAVRGTYSVDEFINGDWQGEDGNQTPFRGHVAGGRIKIEFDPSATFPGYEKNVTYKDPTDGRKASVAALTMKGRTLIWQLVDGSRIERVPIKVVLRRELRPK